MHDIDVLLCRYARLVHMLVCGQKKYSCAAVDSLSECLRLSSDIMIVIVRDSDLGQSGNYKHLVHQQLFAVVLKPPAYPHRSSPAMASARDTQYIMMVPIF
jgi:hypothetical protein